MSPIRVFLVDDHPIVRKGLRALLEEQPDIVVVGEAGSGQQAIGAVMAARPDVVVMDITMPDISGIEATRQLSGHTRVVILSVHSSRDYVGQALRAGAVGYVVKDSVLGDLVAAVRAVASGQGFLSPAVSSLLIEEYVRYSELAAAPDPLELLTPRERQVLRLVAQGCTSREIGALLHLSPKTVDIHRSNAMKKLHLQNTADVVRFAERYGLFR
ncbi:MAG: response regulator transcription factor [Caldilineales bacterium]|nr:response regulator transcription factor [Caldilineales bacterium]MDW8319334.1 response regulator transcription factor [Anaerolineae bacterium]